MSDFKQIDPHQIDENAIKLIGSDWMLITAGSIDSYNMMTASWGSLGVLWNKNVATCFIRPHRHTFEFIEKADNYTLTFFDEDKRTILEYCGTESGRDVDKMNIDGLTPVTGDGTVYFAESKLTLVCRKLYYQDITPLNFVDPAIDENYPEKDYHRMYIGEITSALVKG